MREKLKKIIENIIPNKFQLGFRYSYLKLFNKLDTEMFYISKRLNNNRRFIDIGANVGIYSYHFRNIFKNIDSFEPINEITYRIKALNCSNIHIHNIALSNQNGHRKLNIPVINGVAVQARASIENADNEKKNLNIETRTLDSYGFDDVDLIKIDVEGHEESVIIGAQETIKKNMPLLLIEIEQRHINKDISEIHNILLNMNYDGFFLKNGEIISITDFDYNIHQKAIKNEMSKNYINNFIFIPRK